MQDDASLQQEHERELTAEERELLLRILGGSPFPGSADLTAQVPLTRVVGGLPTLLNLEVARSATRAAVPDGPIPGRAFVRPTDGSDEEESTEGELLVWVRDGYLSAIEFAWYVDTPPQGLPEPDRVWLDAR
jgi:hypothetical protein